MTRNTPRDPDFSLEREAYSADGRTPSTSSHTRHSDGIFVALLEQSEDRPDRSPYWFEVKNPTSPAMVRAKVMQW
jgi:hypothetical protein